VLRKALQKARTVVAPARVVNEAYWYADYITKIPKVRELLANIGIGSAWVCT
jgi:hypothetical protein